MQAGVEGGGEGGGGEGGGEGGGGEGGGGEGGEGTTLVQEVKPDQDLNTVLLRNS